MAMQMQRAFNSRFLVELTRYYVAAGAYNEFNEWVEGTSVSSIVKGRVIVGNKFSQFEEGMAIHNEDGGTRVSDYRSLYITDFFTVDLGDVVVFKGVAYNVLQESDESHFGFKSFLLEKSKNWSEPV
jgi:hypothetical protein